MSNLQSVDQINLIDNKVAELQKSLEEINDIWEDLNDSNIQQLTETLIKIYAAKASASNGDVTYKPISNNRNITETEAAIFVDNLLQITNIEIFELQIWRNMAGY